MEVGSCGGAPAIGAANMLRDGLILAVAVLFSIRNLELHALHVYSITKQDLDDTKISLFLDLSSCV